MFLRTLLTQRLLYFPPGVYVTAIFTGAFAFGVGFDTAITSFWDSWNKGVRAAVLRDEVVWC